MTQILASTISGAVVSLVVWLALYRPIKRRDDRMNKLEDDVEDLREQKVKRLEKDVDKAQEGRRRLHTDMSACKDAQTERINEIRNTFVHKKECADFREAEAQQFARFNESVLTLARVSERTDIVMKRSEQLLQEVINVKGDVAGMAAQIETTRAELNRTITRLERRNGADT